MLGENPQTIRENMGILVEASKENIIPKLITEWKYAKYIVFKEGKILSLPSIHRNSLITKETTLTPIIDHYRLVESVIFERQCIRCVPMFDVCQVHGMWLREDTYSTENSYRSQQEDKRDDVFYTIRLKYNQTETKNKAKAVQPFDKPGLRDEGGHEERVQIRYCATCNSDTHYTGQARCPKYPRTNLITSTDPTHVPIDTHKPIPKPIPKPSQSVFKPTLPKPELSYADAAKTLTTKTTTTDDPQTDKTTTEQLVEGVLRSAMQKIESYIDRQLNRLQDEIVTFTISLLTTDTNPTKRHTTLATANQAARRLLRKRVAHHFVGNRLRVSLAPLQKRD
ncbi:hypothetical protein ANN_16467 [Periplaneta americana]|uniref:Uncharacterized protein n=1 Tax=Periplaneta americana TaxID=6978 RepID=A0ABQ8SK99_PERAM|nr:hypothetical protein ANN_16467 [Periplaneta americana]